MNPGRRRPAVSGKRGGRRGHGLRWLPGFRCEVLEVDQQGEVAAGKHLGQGSPRPQPKAFDGDVDVRQGFAIVRIRLAGRCQRRRMKPARALDLASARTSGGEGGEGAEVVVQRMTSLPKSSRSWRAEAPGDAGVAVVVDDRRRCRTAWRSGKMGSPLLQVPGQRSA